jgi:cellulose biosynthesis protein BcsQ
MEVPMSTATHPQKRQLMADQQNPEIQALRRTVLVANRKGGVGKTSVVTTVASMIASPDRRVLVIDSDSQGNATKSDLGVTDGDDGRSFMSALQYGDQMTVLPEVRPGLDLVAGGSHLASVGAIMASAGQSGTDVSGNLRRALAAACQRGNYTLVLIDTGPGDVPLLDAFLHSVRYLLVPTKEDDAGLDGVEQLATRFMNARRNGALVSLLGVVLFDANPRATSRNGEVLGDIDAMLGGSGTSAFHSVIRNDKAAAKDLRAAHMTVTELVTASQEQQRNRLTQLRGGKHTRRSTAEDAELRLYSRDPSALATDYQALTREVLERVATAERAGASQ